MKNWMQFVVIALSAVFTLIGLAGLYAVWTSGFACVGLQTEPHLWACLVGLAGFAFLAWLNR